MTLDRMIQEMESNTDDGNWTKLVETRKKKLTFKQFVKNFKKNARKNNKAHILPHMKDSYYQSLYNKSEYSKDNKQKISKKDSYELTSGRITPKKITVKRKGKTYTRLSAPRYKPATNLAFKIASKAKPRSKQYKQYVENLVTSTGRTRQAIIKKIQRTRKSNAFLVNEKGKPFSQTRKVKQ